MLAAITAPTLILQGTIDNLFPPSEAIANYKALRASGVPYTIIRPGGLTNAEPGKSAFVLEQGDKVMVNMFFKGREIVHQEFGRATMEQFIKALEDITKVEKPPKLEGHRLSLTLMPK